MKAARWIVIVLVLAAGAWLTQTLSFPRISSSWVEERMRAVEGTTDQSVLAEVALHDSDLGVRQAAVEKLTDQLVLAQVAINDRNQDVRLAAVEGLIDEAGLSEVSTCAEDPVTRHAAVEMLTDQALLARVASTDRSQTVRRHATERLNEEDLVLRSLHTADSEQSDFLPTVVEFLRAANDVPAEHASRILSDLLLVANEYSQPRWLALYGSLDALSIEWSSTSNAYGHGRVYGERIIMTARFAGTDRRMFCVWETFFPQWEREDTYWIPATISASDAFIPWLANHEDALVQIATSNAAESVRIAAVMMMGNQAVLTRIASEDARSKVRWAADNRLDDLRQWTDSRPTGSNQ